jgi:hypothetical protein
MLTWWRDQISEFSQGCLHGNVYAYSAAVRNNVLRQKVDTLTRPCRHPSSTAAANGCVLDAVVACSPCSAQLQHRRASW